MYDYNQKPDLNITPLVDVMLVLLAILMITAPTIEYEEQLNLPQGSAKQEVSDIKNIQISIEKNKVIIIDQSKSQFINFSENFQLFSANLPKDTPIHIRADKTLFYSDVMYILKVVKETGFAKVSLITDG
ncbi:MAG: biopolymer transporter ExbD [Arcobacter sp.]|nr:biopolymer transporter ExbD [Arcobacter sp.]